MTSMTCIGVSGNSSSAELWPRSIRGARRAMIVAVVAALGLTGCGGGDGDREPRDETEATAVDQGTFPVETLVVPAVAAGSTPASPANGEIVWASAVDPATNAPTERVERFSVDAPRLYAVVDVTGLPTGAVVSGAWTYNDVPLEELNVEVTITGSTAETTWIEFHLERTADRWPAGTYEIAIWVDGDVLRSSSVEVTGVG
jgi:hypothetical protein